MENGVNRESVAQLREITEETLWDILSLKVEDWQNKFVASNAVSIAEAHFPKHAWFRGIYADDTAVGFLMLFDHSESAEYYLWRFMIDSRYQKLGFGRQAMRL